jgi:hypothetical protein
VRLVRPAGPGWSVWRQRTGVEPQETLLDLISQLLGSCAVLFGALLGLGGFLLKLPLWGWVGLGWLPTSTLAAEIRTTNRNSYSQSFSYDYRL